MAKYIHLFQTEQEFEDAYENNYVEPWVSYTVQTDSIDMNYRLAPFEPPQIMK